MKCVVKGCSAVKPCLSKGDCKKPENLACLRSYVMKTEPNLPLNLGEFDKAFSRIFR